MGIALLALRPPRTASEPVLKVLPYPDGKTYALSIVDDADGGTLPKIAPVYAFLNDLGFRVTKTVWMFPAEAPSGDLECTLQAPGYAKFARGLARRGHEIALHGVSAGHDTREQIIAGLNIFKKTFGQDPRMHVDHSKNLENLYFGKNRLNSPLFRFLYSLYDPTDFYGEDEKSRHFWGDIAREHIQYHRGWYFTDLNTLSVNPSMPYHDPTKPYARYWHSVTDAFDVKSFMRRMSPRALQSLKRSRGASILYTHFAFGFYDTAARSLHPGFVATMRPLAADPELWVTPASDLLDRLMLFKNVRGEPEKTGFMLYNLNNVEVRAVTLALPSEPGGASRGRESSSLKDPGLSDQPGVRPIRLGVWVVDRLPPRSVTRLASLARAVPEPAAFAISANENRRCLMRWLVRALRLRTL